jgi:hypothetical protein
MPDEVTKRVAKLMRSPLFPLSPTGELKELSALMDSEFPREGENGRPCHGCDKPERALYKRSMADHFVRWVGSLSCVVPRATSAPN